MTERYALSALAFASALAIMGCRGDNSPEARTAEDAVGVTPASETTKRIEAKHDVTVIKEAKVVDNQTGKVLSDTKESTPVRVTEEKQVKSDVKVNVGDTATTKK